MKIVLENTDLCRAIQLWMDKHHPELAGKEFRINFRVRYGGEITAELTELAEASDE